MSKKVSIQSRKTVIRLIMSVVFQEYRLATFQCLVVLGTKFVSNLIQFVIKKKHQELQMGSFLNTYHEKHQRNSRKCRESTSIHTCSLLAPVWSYGASNKPAFTVVVALGR